MSFGLGNGKPIDPAPGVVGVSKGPGCELPPLPDEAMTDPSAGRLDPRDWFADPARPFELEIGSGKGTFLVQQAELQPSVNFLGMEWTHEFYAYAADRVRRRREADNGLSNIRLLCADATEFLHWRCPANLCHVLHLYFSDPWPKARHHKKRVVQHAFLANAWRVLTDGSDTEPVGKSPAGELRVVTDHDDLWAWDRDHFDRWTTPAAWADLGIEAPPGTTTAPYTEVPFDRPESAGEGEVVGTNFERKFRREGRSFHATVLRKNAAPTPSNAPHQSESTT
ncbi:MAG: tRNA (guanine-N7-)-methyltransferase [Phycisphaerales bacterium]|jgi:tRNA (guanine-N7-)-methyltransferase